MNNQSLRILLLEDTPSDARRIQDHLQDGMQGRFICTCTSTVGEMVEQLREIRFDVILLDLNLPERQGLETFLNVQAQARSTPILLLTGTEDQNLALQAVQAGAQDCLIKHQITSSTLARAIRYAIERQRLQTDLHNLSLNDSLTGLYNRRGFFVLANEQLKLLHRSSQGLLLFLYDVNRMRAINDTFGYSEGDQALVSTSGIFCATFRNSDITARLGGDEFVILVIGTLPATAELLQARLQANLNRHNMQSRRPYQLTFTSGIAYAAPGEQATVEGLIQTAQEELQERKRADRKVWKS